MIVTHSQVRDTLAAHDPAALRAILVAAGITVRGEPSGASLAKRIADALWWYYCTPLGYLSDRATLDDIVAHAARRVGQAHRVTAADPWQASRQLAGALLDDLARQGVSLDDLDESTRKRIRRSWLPSLSLGSTAATAGGAFWTSGRVLGFLGGPIGRVLPWIPPLMPYVEGVRRGASAVRIVSGPLGVALTALSINQALGADDRKLIPLVLGVGALGPAPVSDAHELSH